MRELPLGTLVDPLRTFVDRFTCRTSAADAKPALAPHPEMVGRDTLCLDFRHPLPRARVAPRAPVWFAVQGRNPDLVAADNFWLLKIYDENGALREARADLLGYSITG